MTFDLTSRMKLQNVTAVFIQLHMCVCMGVNLQFITKLQSFTVYKISHVQGIVYYIKICHVLIKYMNYNGKLNIII